MLYRIMPLKWRLEGGETRLWITQRAGFRAWIRYHPDIEGDQWYVIVGEYTPSFKKTHSTFDEAKDEVQVLFMKYLLDETLLLSAQESIDEIATKTAASFRNRWMDYLGNPQGE